MAKKKKAGKKAAKNVAKKSAKKRVIKKPVKKPARAMKRAAKPAKKKVVKKLIKAPKKAPRKPAKRAVTIIAPAPVVALPVEVAEPMVTITEISEVQMTESIPQEPPADTNPGQM